MNEPRWKPPFMRWWESDFSGSFSVRMMKPLARLMYRALLAALFHSDNPPYAPNNDAVLVLMADAPSPEDWAAHKATILQRFQKTDDGLWLYHPKALREYERALAEHESKSDAGKLRWQNEQQGPKAPKPAADDGLSAPLMEVWGFYIEQTDRNPKTYSLTPLRKHKGLARLRECLQKTKGDLAKAIGLMKLAIEKLAASDWHMGRDAKSNGKRFCDWESHVFKSYEQMERWWNA